ncbi:hypothetical protein Lepto7376_3975 [[Leptolyngbya] sp. PCC 7376]|uniref:hypothetical protein n=1 Tax=[Leptolyngbya] sp. PCC 7376 TaxID=111781 RepID=UPI00029F4078|nr:hypothetical protein [[Leptolyngbya] sp. PCC 7376]AFY40115.1 hypothetical protein Lepto7376_3975 [[Leptolyngbya] sp. PCC 7376]
MTNAHEILLAHDPKFHTGETQESEVNQSESTLELSDEKAEEFAPPVEPLEITATELTPIYENAISVEQIVNVTSFALLLIVPVVFWLFRYRQ